MRKVFLIFCIVCLLATVLSGCRHQLVLADFDFLKAGMSYSEIVSRVGKPSEEVGSGLYIFHYNLSDGKVISLYFAKLDSLMMAKVYDPQTDTGTWLVKP